MKMKSILLLILLFGQTICWSQYIGVKAKYTATRLVDDSPNPPKRENRLVLSFFTVSDIGDYTPTVLNNYDLWVYKQGFQYGNGMGGVLDSTGNNYPGYSYPAPIAVSYYNSLGRNYIDCDPNAMTHFVVNGHELDCGFVTVSYWDVDHGTGQAVELFPAPNIGLRYYIFPEPYSVLPGNVNFPYYGTPPYNWYNFSCGGNLQLVIRGVLPHDSSFIALPVRFDNVRASLINENRVKVEWSNLTESDILYYIVQRSLPGSSFTDLDTIYPTHNAGGRADYAAEFFQAEPYMLYRIRAVEFNGHFVYSPVVSLRLAERLRPVINPPRLSLFPNPATNGRFTVQLPDASPGRYQLRLIHSTGQVILARESLHTGGMLQQPVSIRGEAPGIYYLQFQGGGQNFMEKIFISF